VFGNPRGKHVLAVDDISFTVAPGEVFGLLGPNGAGKTSTLRILGTLLAPTSGSARVAGFDVFLQGSEVRHRIGYLSATTGVYDRMSAWEMVAYYGSLHGLKGDELNARLDQVFTLLQMNDFRNRHGGQMSTGMRQKVSIARALIHDPPVLIFDEPTAGLDVLVQRSVLRQVERLREAGKCIVFSTHILHEAEQLCDRIAIMAHGKIAACGTAAELRDQHSRRNLEELFFKLVGADEE
jgi:sodium transport system ATP-binding protein